MAVPHHVYMRNARVKVLVTDDGKTEFFIESRRMYLCAEHLLSQAAFFGFCKHGLDQRHAYVQAAPVFEYRYSANMPVGQQARGANGVVTLKGEKVHGISIFGVPFEFRRY